MENDSEPILDMLSLLFGGGVEQVGDEAARLSAPRRENLAHILRSALRRLGARVSAPGAVPGRALAHLFGDASYCGDVLAREYWGGLLAASCSDIPGDDRCVAAMAQLTRLATHQVRAHYLFYSTLRRLLATTRDINTVDFDSKRYRMATFVPGYHFVQAMGLGGEKVANLGGLVSDALAGLNLELLLDGSNTGSENYLRKFFDSAAIRGEGIVFAPSLAGVRLFTQVFGGDVQALGRYLLPGFECAVDGVPQLIEGAALVYTQD